MNESIIDITLPSWITDGDISLLEASGVSLDEFAAWNEDTQVCYLDGLLTQIVPQSEQLDPKNLTTDYITQRVTECIRDHGVGALRSGDMLSIAKEAATRGIISWDLIV
jgi:hypothetical protein